MALTPVTHASTTALTGTPAAASGSATGQLAGHTVTVGTGATPLVAEGRGVVQAVGDLLKRVVASLPGGAPQVIRQAYGDLDAKGRMEVLDRLEKSLSKAAVALTQEKAGAVSDVVKALGAFAANMAPLAGHDGAGEALSQVVKGVVAQLSPEQAVATLKAIGAQRGAEVQSRLLDQPVASQGLQLLERGLADAVLFNERCKVMEVARKLIPKDIAPTGTDLTGPEKTLIQDSYRDAYKEVLSSYWRMERLGVLGKGEDARLGYINTELAKLLCGPINADKTGANPRILGALGTEYLQMLNNHARHEDGRPMIPEAADELSRRRDAMIEGFADKADAFSANYQPTEDFDMKALVKDLGEVSTMGAEGLKFAARSGIEATALRQDMDNLGKQLDTLAAAGKLDFSCLSDSEAHALEIACSQTGSSYACPMIKRECDARGITLREDYHQAVDSIVAAARARQLPELLQAVHDSGKVRDEVAFSLAPLGLNIEGADNTMEAREFLIDDRVTELSVDTLIDLLSALREPTVRAMVRGLPELAFGLTNGSGHTDNERFKQVCNAGDDLKFLTDSVERRLKSLGALPPAGGAVKELGLKNINDSGFDAIRKVFDIEANGKGVIRALSGTVAGVSGEVFADAVTAAPSTDMQRVPAKIVASEVGVCEQFLVDMNRAQFSAGGMPLIDRGAWEMNSGDLGGQIAMQMAGIERLTDALGGDYSLVFAVSQYANQATLAPLTFLLAGPHSPLKLADGTVGTLVGGPGQQASSYDIALTEDGKATIGFKLVMEGQQFMTTDGRVLLLDRDHGTAEFNFQLTVDRDGTARLTKPLGFKFDLEQYVEVDDASNNPDAADEAIMKMGMPYFEALHEFAEQNYSDDDTSFITDYLKYKSIDDTDGTRRAEAARRLYDTYIASGSTKELNLGSGARETVVRALNEGNTDKSIFKAFVLAALNNMVDVRQRFETTEKGKSYVRK
ncbi:MAG TPA: hypothetical protein VK196_04845 [Magnetospirillum sp.]|nr:hypothetical protein [Magnetospirillum sp.]